jgi:hypothetical protein
MVSLLVKILGMIALGIFSAILSYYNKNYYVRVFNDILGRDEDDDKITRIGRGFYYGFFFPIYFMLLLCGLAALIAFLITAGIIAAIVFVMVWITEKLLPANWIGDIMLRFFQQVGMKGADPQPQWPTTTPVAVPDSSASSDASEVEKKCCEKSSCNTEGPSEK